MTKSAPIGKQHNSPFLKNGLVIVLFGMATMILIGIVVLICSFVFPLAHLRLS